MALPFLSGQAKQLEQIISIDLGARTTKAVHLQRKREGLNFLSYALQDAPAYEKGLSPQVLGCCPNRSFPASSALPMRLKRQNRKCSARKWPRSLTLVSSTHRSAFSSTAN